jgi:hypothetical protein
MRHVPSVRSTRRHAASVKLAALVGMLALPQAAASAQAAASSSADSTPSRALQLSFGGGFSKVSSSPLSATNQGYSLHGALGLQTPLRVLAVQLEGLFSEAGATRVGAVTASARLSAPDSWNARPYLVAGVGGYRENGASVTAGFNLGIGANVRVGGQTLFMESRMHSYRDALAGQPYVLPRGVVDLRRNRQQLLWQPLTFGFRF